ncbi:MAG: Eco57I restriction-modification methylase domain-containing protein [Elusimicrobiales bacterium]|nr:Eco57I restriction-modification methylase domain-containing protein [Elusimicrobiales bacterium]
MNETIEKDILSKPFNKEDIKNLLIDNFLPENFEIKEEKLSLNEIGKFEKIQEVSSVGKSNNPEIKLLFIKHSGINDPRITITKETFKIVKGFRFKKSIIVYYSDNSENYRISLVTLDTVIKGEKGTEDILSNPKRYSYFLGPDAKVKTPYINLVSKGRVETEEDLKQRFSVEVVTKEFYKELANWYFWAVSSDDVIFPESKSIPNFKEISLIRFITRIIFVWFMKRKGLIPEKLFDKNYLKTILKDFNNEKSNNYYNAILQNLFFATLNKNIKERNWAKDEGFLKNKTYYGIKNLYRYEDKFLISEKEVLDVFREIPFLNGGLFDCLDKDDIGGEVIDGFSRNPKKRALICDYLLFDDKEKEVNLSGFGLGKNEKVKGLFEILNQYNFTIDENTPVDQELSLDPELLGKVFENLLASYNPETSTTARKSTGSYYTPREIVDYMVKESLKEYLKTKLENEKIEKIDEKLENLFSYETEKNPFEDNITKSIIEHINKLKVIDPAVGSGAFPMGMLQKLVFILSKLDPKNEIWKGTQLENALKETEETLKSKKDKEEREEILKDINEVFDENINNPDYARKLYLIENCLYGVDIQPIAIQISKLRFFISLVLEQNIKQDKDNFGIRPLPNLETKLISANTLIGLEKDDFLYHTETIKNIEDEIKFLRHKYFNAKTRTQKLECQEKDKKLREKLKEELINIGFNLENSQKIANFDPYDQNTSADWFDPEWMFGVKDGFDIVIGNPPYIQLQKPVDPKNKYADLYKDLNYQTFERTGDIYCLFYEKGINLLKENGHLIFITSNKWMRAGYGENLRNFFTKYNPKILIDLGPNIFESATVDTNIFLIQKSQNKKMLKSVTISQKDKENINLTNILKENSVILNKLGSDAWFIGNDLEQKLKEKIEKIGKPLKDWDVKIYRGILTGLNDAFIIDSDKRKEILDNCLDKDERKRTEAIIKPILRGRDIKRYSYEWAGLWVIIIPAGWTDEHRNGEKPEVFIKKTFSSIMNYLQDFEKEAKKRDDQGDYWWELRACAYYPEFEKEKIIWQELAQGSQFTLDDKGSFFVSNTAYLLVTNDNLKYLLGYLNSKLNFYTFNKWYCTKLGEKATRWLNQHVIEIPISPITNLNKSIVNQIEILVDKILSAKKDNPNSDTSKLESEIDQLVYKLYSLTQEEIQLIEGEK